MGAVTIDTPGYCYLVLFRRELRAKALELLGKFPRATDVLYHEPLFHPAWRSHKIDVTDGVMHVHKEGGQYTSVKTARKLRFHVRRERWLRTSVTVMGAEGKDHAGVVANSQQVLDKIVEFIKDLARGVKNTCNKAKGFVDGKVFEFIQYVTKTFKDAKGDIKARLAVLQAIFAYAKENPVEAIAFIARRLYQTVTDWLFVIIDSGLDFDEDFCRRSGYRPIAAVLEMGASSLVSVALAALKLSTVTYKLRLPLMLVAHVTNGAAMYLLHRRYKNSKGLSLVKYMPDRQFIKDIRRFIKCRSDTGLSVVVSSGCGMVMRALVNAGAIPSTVKVYVAAFVALGAICLTNVLRVLSG